MSGPNSKKQKASWQILDVLFADAAHLWVIHYSCESFYNRPNGQSPRITSIAVRKLLSGQTRSFSIHQIAELKGVPFQEIDQHYDLLELEMLNAFYAHVSSFQSTKYLHWNMRDINYGFAAIEHRHRILGGQPVVIDDDKKIDLSRVLIDIYGTDYAAHPRLATLLTINSIQPKDFLNGEKESQAFENRDFVALHQSTLRKVDILADIFQRAHERQLKTNTTWWTMHGDRVRTVVDWLVENKIIAFLIALAGLVLTLWSFKK
ncbi:MAG TPA: hypothetical protein VK638_11595 [Edaphobacter sp.]|nr:hypothetical protein [Edaphobacter sp.]